jgi:hypothetical protein
MSLLHRPPAVALLWGLAVIGPGCVGGKASGTERDAMSELHKIPDEAAAIEEAKRRTGLGDPARKVSAERVLVSATDAPFVAAKIIGRRAFRVTFEDIRLKLPSSIPGFPDRYRRRFVVLLDEETAQVLGIENPYEGQDPDLLPPPSSASAEAQIRGTDEVYTGLPDEPPKVTFLGALDAVLSKGVGSPFEAKSIQGLYVMHSRMGSPPRAVWVVTLWGLPPLETGAPRGPRAAPVPAWQRNHMRNVVDATTGQVLFATTVPQPDPPKK